MPKRLKKVTEEIMHQNPWWIYMHDRYIMPNGKEGDYFYAKTKGGAMIIPVLPDGRVVLTLQHRYLVDKLSIEFPAGSSEKDAGMEDVARRELQEETGYLAKDMVKLASFEPANGFTVDTVHVFLAQVEEQHNQKLDESEDIEILYRRIDEVDRMIQQGDIWCGQSIAAWFFAKQYLSHNTF